MEVAFQPIVSASALCTVIYGYEALARDASGRVPRELIRTEFSRELYRFDYACRILALRSAVELGLSGNLSLNITPGAVCDSNFGVAQTLQIADDIGFPRNRIIFELTERERIDDYRPIRQCLDRYRHDGVRVSIDDFGTGFNGLNTLLELRPDSVKIDMALVRKIEDDDARRALMFGICAGGARLGIRAVAEGVETLSAVSALSALDIDLMQGFYFARPQIGILPCLSPAIEQEVVQTLSKMPKSALPGDMTGAVVKPSNRETIAEF